MTERWNKDNALLLISHRGFPGGVHYFDVADGYGATLVFHGNRPFLDKECYNLTVPEKGEVLAKNLGELQTQWAKLIDDFLVRHPEYVGKDT